MATDKNFVIKNGLTVGTTEVIDSSGNLVNTSGTISGTTITGSDRGTFEDLVLTGDSDDDLTFTVASGDWSIKNSQQNNGLVIYDGTAGVKLLYNNSEKLEVLTGGLNVVNGTLSIAGTEFADASRNITAGTISSGAITAGTFVSATDYMRVTATGGAKNILLGNQDSGGVDKPAIIQGVNGRLRLGHGNSWTTSGGTFTTVIDLASNNLDISTGALQMGSTTVIDSSRNLTNIGTISSTGNVTHNITATQEVMVKVTNDSGQRNALTLNHEYDRDIGIHFHTTGGDYEVWIDSAGDDSLILSPGTVGDPALELYQNKNAQFYGNIIVSGTVDGRDVATDGTKLDGIAAGATNTAAPFYTSAITSSDVTTALGYTPYQESTGLSATTGSFTGTVNMDGVLQLDRGSGVDTALEFLDSGGDYSIKHNVNDGNGNYSISIGYKGDGNGQYAVTGDGVGKILFGGHGRDGAISLNAAPTGTASNDISFSIGLLVDGSDNTIRVGASANGTGMDLGATDGTKVFDASANAFATSYSVGSTTVIDSSNFLQNVTLKIGTTGARFQGNGWHYDTNNDARFYFESSNRTFYRADGGHHFRANGDTTRLTISQSGGINLFSNGDTQAGTGEVINVAGTNILDSSRNLTNIGTISSGAISSTGNLDVDGIIDNTRNNGNISPPSTSDHTAGTRIKFYDANATAFYAIGIESDTMWFNSDVQYKWYQDAVERMTLSNGGNLSVDGTISSGAITSTGTSNFNLITVDTNGGTSSVADEFRIGADNYDTGTAFSGVTIRPSDSVNPDVGGTLLMVRSGGGSPRWFVQHSGICGTSNTDIYVSTGTDMSGGNRVFHDGYHPNADTLTTARTIGGVSFNGSANINLPGVNTAGNQNTSGTAAGLSGTPNITVGTITSSSILVQTSVPTLRLKTSANSNDPFFSMESSGTGTLGEGFEMWYVNSIGDFHMSTTYNDNAASLRFHTKTGGNKSTSNERFTIEGGGDINIVSGALKFGGTTVIDSSRNLTNIGTISSGQINTTTGADATPAIIATNTGGIGGVLQRWVGDSDSMEMQCSGTGDYKLRNTQQNNGINFFDGTGGVEIEYSGTRVQEWDSTGGTNLATGSFKVGGTEVVSAARDIFSDGLTIGSWPVGSNTGQGRIGKASDRTAGTITNQIGGGSSAYWEIVDYAWSTVVAQCNNSGDFTAYRDFNTNTGGYEVNNTTVIDSARNATFVNLRADGGNLIMGDEAYSTSSAYVGMKTSFQSGANDYMILSGTSDGNTYVSAKDGSSAVIRGGGNNGNNEFEVPDGTTMTATTSNFRVTGNITAYASDKRLKTNIQTIENPIEKIKKIRGVEFDWIDNIENFNPKFEHETGVIAQEIEEVIPDAVSPAPFNEEYKTVDKEKIVALLIEGMKDQQKQIEELKEEVSSLRSKI